MRAFTRRSVAVAAAVMLVVFVFAVTTWDSTQEDVVDADGRPRLGTALRFAAFNVVSIATTTGYANTDFNLWPIFAPLWMLFLCSFASCSSSSM